MAKNTFVLAFSSQEYHHRQCKTNVRQKTNSSWWVGANPRACPCTRWKDLEQLWHRSTYWVHCLNAPSLSRHQQALVQLWNIQ